MKKIITFKGISKKEIDVFLIQKVNEAPYKIKIDFEKGLIKVEDVEDTMIDTVIELIKQYYTYDSISIDSTSNDSIFGETSESKEEQNVKNVMFRDKTINDLMNQLIKTIFWAMEKKGVPEKKIGDFIRTSINEISMQYNGKGFIKYDVGDIVDCNYGIHLNGETNGGHIWGIVCNSIDDGYMAYVVPITKMTKDDLSSDSHLAFSVSEDVILNNERASDGVVLLDKGKYLRAERFYEVIGKTTHKFFNRLLQQLSTTFDFTNSRNTIAEDGSTLQSTMSKPKAKGITKKLRNEELALLNVIGDSLEKLDHTKTFEEQVESFLTDIGMKTTEKMISQSFVVACNIKKINYENVILELRKIFPNVSENRMKVILRENFKNWLKTHPELVESCPKISIMSLLKVFAKKFA